MRIEALTKIADGPVSRLSHPYACTKKELKKEEEKTGHYQGHPASISCLLKITKVSKTQKYQSMKLSRIHIIALPPIISDFRLTLLSWKAKSRVKKNQLSREKNLDK